MATRSGDITFLTRSGCAICDDAREQLKVPSRVLRIAVESVDVDRDPELLELYGARVPVLLSRGGSILAEGRLTRWGAWRAVSRARRR